MTGSLSSLVTGAAAKRLSAVEALPNRSNQHEFNGVQLLKEIFGEARHRFDARFVYIGRDDEDATFSEGFVTWYDARESHPTRSEYRLYFPSTDASERLCEGDLALVLRRADGSVLVAFAPRDSTAEKQLLWLFGLAAPQDGVEVTNVSDNDSNLGFAARTILAQLGIEPEVGPAAEESYLEILLDRFGGGFPSTAEFSEFARQVTPDVEPVEDPDEALMAWLEREEALFRQLERHLVLQRLRQGFGDDVDAFVQFSLSVQNRRKSRVGYALEHHLEAIFRANGLAYSRGQVTERSSRPDFVFPSIQAYRDPAFPEEQLTLLGVKSTCKDRWRQILAEGDRVPIKHLLTLEPGISANQVEEMASRQVVLVVPLSIQNSFSDELRDSLMSVSDLIRGVRSRQSTGSARNGTG